MEQQQIRNIHEDFTVYPGMMLTSLPPRIGFSAVINATDQKTYFAEGGTFTNMIGDMGVSLRELVFYPDILNPSIMTLSDHVSQRQMPFEKLLNLDPKITVSKGSIYDVDDNYSVNAQPYELILNLDQNDTVSFYNNFDFPVRIQAEIKDYDNNNSKESDSQSNLETGTIASQKTGTIQFDKIGQYEWHAMVHPMSQDDPDGTWTKIRGEGQITIVSQKTEDLPLEEKIEIARFFIDHSREDIPWTSLGSGQGQYVEIGIPKSIHKMVPNSKEYYEKRAQEWIPFEVPIKIR